MNRGEDIRNQLIAMVGALALAACTTDGAIGPEKPVAGIPATFSNGVAGADTSEDARNRAAAEGYCGSSEEGCAGTARFVNDTETAYGATGGERYWFAICKPWTTNQGEPRLVFAIDPRGERIVDVYNREEYSARKSDAEARAACLAHKTSWIIVKLR